jgi:hypothetical protein
MERAGGDYEAGVKLSRLADGTEVPTGSMRSLLVALADLLADPGSLDARITAEDLTRLALTGQQPVATPDGDRRPQYAAIGLGELQSDGALQLHPFDAAVIANAVHVDPAGSGDFMLVDPTQSFTGFGGSGVEA